MINVCSLFVQNMFTIKIVRHRVKYDGNVLPRLPHIQFESVDAVFLIQIIESIF